MRGGWRAPRWGEAAWEAAEGACTASLPPAATSLLPSTPCSSDSAATQGPESACARCRERRGDPGRL